MKSTENFCRLMSRVERPLQDGPSRPSGGATLSHTRSFLCQIIFIEQLYWLTVCVIKQRLCVYPIWGQIHFFPHLIFKCTEWLFTSSHINICSNQMSNSSAERRGIHVHLYRKELVKFSLLELHLESFFSSSLLVSSCGFYNPIQVIFYIS